MHPMTPYGVIMVWSLHKLMGIYMESLILGTILQWIFLLILWALRGDAQKQASELEFFQY